MLIPMVTAVAIHEADPWIDAQGPQVGIGKRGE